jgi:hypothetical protein
VDPNLSIETYRALSEFSGINLSAFQRANNHWVSNAQTCHLKGSLNDRATRLEKVRFEQSSDESTTEEIGSFSISVKADKDVEIKNVSMFFRVLFVWVWGHVGAGMCQVSPQAGRPNAGRMGDEGGLPDGGRVYVTLASMMQYTYFLYSVAHRGVECLLQLHALVMRPVCDFVLHNDYNFASALTRVLSMHTSDSLLGRYSSGTVDKLPDSAAPGGKKGRGKFTAGVSTEDSKEELIKKITGLKRQNEEFHETFRLRNLRDQQSRKSDSQSQGKRHNQKRSRSRSRSRERDRPKDRRGSGGRS